LDWRALLHNDRVIAALVTALVGGGVVAAGWFWTHWLSRIRDRSLRWERISDIQRALLAEIRAHVVALEAQQDAGGLAALDFISDEDYLPILPHEANDRIFLALVEDVHMLPEWAIDPVVRYYRLLSVRSALAQDIRNNAKDYPERAALMFSDYIEINEETRDTGLEAMEILTASLKGGPNPKKSQAEVETLLAERMAVARRELSANLPAELDRLRSGFNTRFSGRSGQ
jgi:hypothetical protein